MSSRGELLAGYVEALRGAGREIDEAELRLVVDATYRALAVQQLMSIAVLNNESYGADSMYDLWVPRILAGLAAPW